MRQGALRAAYNTMKDLRFVPLDETGRHALEAWFDSDPTLRRYYARPTDDWFDYVRGQPGVSAWMIYDEDLAVGHLQLDIGRDATGYLGLAVNPQLRRRGYGRRILCSFLSRPEVTPLARLFATVHPRNVAGQRRVRAAGFVQQGDEPDEEGFLVFVYLGDRGKGISADY